MHVADPMFGGSSDEIQKKVTTLVWDALKKAPSLQSTDTTLLLLDRYETIFGIYNHDEELTDRPLALVAMHPSEDSVNYGLLRERMTMFVEYAIAKRFGMSWAEFIEQSPDTCEMMIEIAMKKQIEESKLADKISQAMQNNHEGRDE